jgi:uncharacterized membrane protein YhaH (DUF805 family)
VHRAPSSGFLSSLLKSSVLFVEPLFFFPIELLGGPALLVGNLALFLPAIAISARRLHDVDRTGWWLPIWFTVIGAIWLIVWWCTKGKADRNRFGPDPLAAK